MGQPTIHCDPPVLALADTFSTLFDAIATTFEFEWEPAPSPW